MRSAGVGVEADAPKGDVTDSGGEEAMETVDVNPAAWRKRLMDWNLVIHQFVKNILPWYETENMLHFHTSQKTPGELVVFFSGKSSGLYIVPKQMNQL